MQGQRSSRAKILALAATSPILSRAPVADCGVSQRRRPTNAAAVLGLVKVRPGSAELRRLGRSLRAAGFASLKVAHMVFAERSGINPRHLPDVMTGAISCSKRPTKAVTARSTPGPCHSRMSARPEAVPPLFI